MWLYLDTFERVDNPLSMVRDVDAHAADLGLFYFRMPSWGDRMERHDDQGVLVSDFDHHHLRGASGQHYMPINIAQYAIHQYDRSLIAPTEAVRAEARTRFMAQAEWLLRQQVRSEAGGVWQFHFALGNQYNLRPPWVSALAQGEGIAVLCRAYQATGEVRFLEAAREAAQPFGVPIADGGVRWTGPGLDGGVFYEEYPTQPPHHVLNGCITAMFGLVDLQRVAPDEQVSTWLSEGVLGLARLLPAYDTGWWSRYSLSPHANLANHFRLAAPHYHCMHIALLEAFGRATGEEVFRRTARRWLGYTRNVATTALMNLTYVGFKRAVKARNVARFRAPRVGAHA